MIDKLIKPAIVCGALISGVNAETLLEKESKSITNIDTKELVKILKEKPNTQIIDVRTRADILNQGGFLKVNKRTNIQRSEIETLIPQTVSKDEVFVVHGYDGTMSTYAAKRILDMGL